MYDRDLNKTLEWLKSMLKRIINGKEHISMFILSKTLNSYYKNPQSIPHKVLADRIGERDPGNKPKANDRIPVAYIEVDDKPIFMGYKMITKKVSTGKRRMISKKIPDGQFKNGKDKFKTVKVPEGELIYKNEKVPEGEPKYKKKVILQGERIEHPDYIKEKKLPLDYKFYISNQIMNPVKQVLDISMSPEESKELFNNVYYRFSCFYVSWI